MQRVDASEELVVVKEDIFITAGRDLDTTLLLRETCLIVGLRPLIIILIYRSIVLKDTGFMHVWLDNFRRVELLRSSLSSVLFSSAPTEELQKPNPPRVGESGNIVHA